MPLVALSGGVVANRAIRETIRAEITRAGLTLVINDDVSARRWVRLLRPVRLGGNAPYGSTKKVASSGMTSKNKHFILTHVQR